MKKPILLSLTLFLLLTGCFPEEDQRPRNDFKVHAYYVVPDGELYNETNHIRTRRAFFEMQNWYQAATGGLTFEILDEELIVEMYVADGTVDYYGGNWWGLLLDEMKSKNLPVQSPGTITIIWVEGINNVSATATAQGGTSCGGECGAAILPISTLLTSTTPPADMGILLHELGHTLGLRHPVESDDLPLPPEQEPMLFSVMNQTTVRAGSTNAEHGFLTTEKMALYNNPFMKQVATSYQGFWQINIINYPVTGPVPEPRILIESTNYRNVTFSTNIDDGLLYFWNFGDGTVSNEKSPTHTYNALGLYNVTLTVTSADFMTGRSSRFVQLQ